MKVNSRRDAEYLVSKNYGEMISLGESRPKKGSDEIRVYLLNSHYRRIIQDESGGNQIHYMDLPDIGRIEVDADGEVVKRTSREEAVDRLNTRLNQWQLRVQNIIVEATADELADFAIVQQYLAPFLKVSAGLFDDHAASTDILKGKSLEKRRKYFGLLEDMGIIKSTSGELFEPDVEGIELLDQSPSKKDFQHAIVSRILKSRYEELKESFRIRTLEPFIELEMVYYQPSLEAGELLSYSEETFIKKIMRSNPRKSRHDIGMTLSSILDKTDIFERDGVIRGNKDYFEDMQAKKEHLLDGPSPLKLRTH